MANGNPIRGALDALVSEASDALVAALWRAIWGEIVGSRSASMTEAERTEGMALTRKHFAEAAARGRKKREGAEGT